MKNKLNNRLFLCIWFMFLECIYRLFVLNNLFSFKTLFVIFYVIIFGLIISILMSLSNEKVNRITNKIYIIFISILYLAQIVYYKFYLSIFSFYSLTTGTGQVFHFYRAILRVILHNFYIFLIVLIPLILYLIFDKNFIKYERINLKRLFINFACIIISFIVIVIQYNTDNDFYSLKVLLNSTHAPMLTIDKTGLVTMELIDIERYIFGFDQKFITYSDVKSYDSNDYNVLDNYENNSELDSYLLSEEASNKNEYTGIFKDKNLIFITAESFDSIAINKDITPTLYKLYTEGINFENYYQPIYPISTSDGEYMNLVSMIPKEGTWSFSDTSNNDSTFTIANLFKSVGYTTKAYHNYNYNFYNRDKSHTNFGFDYIGCGNGLEKLMDCSNWPNSDYDLFSSTIDSYLNSDDKFFTYYMTVSGHLDYNNGINYIANKNKDLVKDLDYSDTIKAYYATEIELDNGLELLLNKLEKANKLDDTVIVICPDHFPYGLFKSEINFVSDTNRDDKFDIYKTSLIIYNSELKNVKVEGVTSGIDIVPTLLNLFGIEYDSRLYMGRDVFSNNERIVILSDRSWITDKGRYDSLNNKFYSNDMYIDEDYVNRINKIVYNKFTISSLVLDNNYYKELRYLYED